MLRVVAKILKILWQVSNSSIIIRSIKKPIFMQRNHSCPRVSYKSKHKVFGAYIIRQLVVMNSRTTLRISTLIFWNSKFFLKKKFNARSRSLGDVNKNKLMFVTYQLSPPHIYTQEPQYRSCRIFGQSQSSRHRKIRYNGVCPLHCACVEERCPCPLQVYHKESQSLL